LRTRAIGLPGFQDAENEARAFFRREHREIIPVRVKQLIDGDVPLQLR
jgi:hypothetical protein